MERPTGVSILAILAFIGSGCVALAGLMFLLGGAMMSSMGAFPRFGMMAGMGSAILGIVCLGFAALYLVVGLGLWKLQSWGRVLTIVLAALGLLVNGFGILGPLMSFHVIFLIWRAAVLGLDVWVLVYLFQPHVKQAFGATSG
ncbi:MAG TPA: hypothetical protein VN822_08745 [Candidatus Acidoferrales bacterium]|nr:hypothetical protein [Candidatus Acidoferrales bacterium]